MRVRDMYGVWIQIFLSPECKASAHASGVEASQTPITPRSSDPFSHPCYPLPAKGHCNPSQYHRLAWQ